MCKNMFDLPVEALNNIISFNLGKPEYYKIKNSQKLRDIQNRYTLYYSEPRSVFNYGLMHCRKFVTTYYFIERDVPFTLLNVKHIIKRQENELLSLLYQEVEGETDFEATLEIILTPKIRGIYNQNGVLFDAPEIEISEENFKDDTSSSVLESIVARLENDFSNFQTDFLRHNLELKYISKVEFNLHIRENPYAGYVIISS